MPPARHPAQPGCRLRGGNALAGLVVAALVLGGTAAAEGVDFLNFTYASTYCFKEFGRDGLGPLIQLQGGEVRVKSGTTVAYAGLNRDGSCKGPCYGPLGAAGANHALVRLSCGLEGANYGLDEVFVYRVAGVHATLVGHLAQDSLEADYRRHVPRGSIRSIEDALIRDGLVVTTALADGPHCCPLYRVAFRYAVRDGQLALTAPPQRQPFGEPAAPPR